MTRVRATLFVIALTGAALGAAPPTARIEFPGDDRAGWELIVQSDRIRAADEAFTQPDSPTVVQSLLQGGRIDAALDVAFRLVESQPERMAETLVLFRGDPFAIATLFNDPVSRQRRARLQELTGIAGPMLSRRADAESADLAEIDRVSSRFDDRAGRLQALERIAAVHPHSVAAAKALYMKGWTLHHQGALAGRDRGDDDPTEDFLQLLGIVKELEEGAYPSSEFVDRAPDLVIEFFAYKPVFRRGNVDRMLAGYEAFVESHLRADTDLIEGSGIGYVVTAKMGDLYEMKGDRVGGLERMLNRLESRSGDPLEVQYLRALVYVRELNHRDNGPAAGARRSPLLKSAVSALSALAGRDAGRFSRLALATLATLQFGERDYSAARASYERYVDSYPSSPFAWVAAVRQGQCADVLGDRAGALAAYRRATDVAPGLRFVRAIADTFSGRTLEADGRADEALAAYRRALDAWEPALGGHHDLYVLQPGHPERPEVSQASTTVERAAIRARVDRLERSLASPGGAWLEYGRWLVDNGQPRAAVKPLQQLLSASPHSQAAADARYLLHRARVEDALKSADEAALSAITSEPFDPAVAAAQIALASRAWLNGRHESARHAFGAALAAWEQASRASIAPPATDLERDVAAIRALMFHPAGGGPHGGTTFGGFGGSDGRKPYVMVDPTTSVTLADGDTLDVTVRQQWSGAPNAIFCGTDEHTLLLRVAAVIGGARTRARNGAMDLFDQPAGASVDMMKLWNEFFFVEPWHWGGWVIHTYPIIDGIEFYDAARTRAGVKMTTGYSGETAIVEKVNGVWTFKEFTDRWVT